MAGMWASVSIVGMHRHGTLVRSRLLPRSETFVTPKLRGEAAATMAAAMVGVAASVAAPNPAVAEVPKFSFFGLGGGIQSDIYNQNDNPINPYSQFSEIGSDNVYQARKPDEVDRRKKDLAAALTRFENTDVYIKTKQAQQLKSNLLEAANMRQDLIYFSGAEGSPAYQKARDFSQKIATLGVDGEQKQWGLAAQDFAAATKILKEWKDVAKF
ncbi:unnamed protein product [Symbiodinium natans]|uniref:Uncharacterized protein n=1 Tax=Symbiodinium natans TaxID=878477 RepID=A0A812V2F9_9DINO|nr:unnamed protein product [Symbiodinium natans]